MGPGLTEVMVGVLIKRVSSHFIYLITMGQHIPRTHVGKVYLKNRICFNEHVVIGVNNSVKNLRRNRSRSVGPLGYVRKVTTGQTHNCMKYSRSPSHLNC